MSDYISEHNLVLIFKYLPVKALLRFRSVCKDWKRLIDSPILVQQHLSVQNPRFIVDPRRQKYLIVDASLPRPLVTTLSKPIAKKNFILVGTLHGVACLYDCSSSLVLWNPSLRKFMRLPFPSDFSWYFAKPVVHDNSCYGFWIDPSTKEYKAIILQRKPVVRCILYSSIRHGWSEIPTEQLVHWKSCKEGPPALISGVAHWGGCLDESVNDYYHYDDHEHKDKVILSFDFVKGCFEFIRMPDLQYMNSAPCRWQGTLSLVCWNDESRCEIYLKQEDSWVKMIDFEGYEPLSQAFWAMEDAEERKKKGKRKRGVEEGIKDSIVGSQPSVRILATVIDEESHEMTGELMLNGTKTGWRTVREGLRDYYNVVVAYDFVESILFP